MRPYRAVFLVLLAQVACTLGAGALGGCEVTGPIEIVIRPDAGGGGAPTPDAATRDAEAVEDAQAPDAADAGPSPVIVSITPNPTQSDPQGPTAGEELEAALTTLAAGVRGVVISRAWRTVASPGGQGYVDLAADVAFYAQHQTQIVLNLAVVDRLEDARPDELVGLPWNDAAVAMAVESTLDKIFLKFGPALHAVTFGRDMDAYIEAHPDESEAIEAFLEHACSFARAHPVAPLDLSVGAAVSFQGAVVKGSSYDALLASSDMLALSYFPGLGGAGVAPVSEVASHLDTMIAASGGKPILLQAVGYPSDPVVQSSPDKQRLFYDTFFDALAPRRASFPWVNVFELHDLSPAACEAYAQAQGEPLDGPVAGFLCSLGLFTAAAEGKAGAEKPAWLSVLEGTATFASP